MCATPGLGIFYLQHRRPLAFFRVCICSCIFVLRGVPFFQGSACPQGHSSHSYKSRGALFLVCICYCAFLFRGASLFKAFFFPESNRPKKRRLMGYPAPKNRKRCRKYRFLQGKIDQQSKTVQKKPFFARKNAQKG